MKIFLIISLIMLLFLIGCTSYNVPKDSVEIIGSTPTNLEEAPGDYVEEEGDFTKTEAESLANFVVNTSDSDDAEILQSYRKGNIWNIRLNSSGQVYVVEVNAKTGNIECVTYGN